MKKIPNRAKIQLGAAFLVLTTAFVNCSPTYQPMDLGNGWQGNNSTGSGGTGTGTTNPTPAPMPAPQVCSNGSSMKPAASRRLTSREYKNSLVSIFGAVYAGTSGDVRKYPDDIANRDRLVVDFDTTVGRTVNLGDVESYGEVARLVGDGVANGVAVMGDRTKVTALLGSDCVRLENPVSGGCWAQTYSKLGLRIYRRPLTTEEVNTLVAISTDAVNASKYEGLSLAIQFMLLKYDFLYKVEGGTTAGFYALNDFEIATRLAYTLTSTTPPDFLLDAAAAGLLKDTAMRMQFADQLIATADFGKTLDGFYRQWLRLDDIPYFWWIGPEGYSADELRSGGPQEAIDFAKHITTNTSGTYAELMTSQLVIPKNASLAKIYGTAISSTPIAAPGGLRPGILTRAGVMMDNGTYPGHVRRGVRLITDIMCQTMGPPPDVSFNNISTFNPLSSTRQQITDKTSATSCMSCHSQLNPAGFAFNSYDGVGRYRTSETVTSNNNSATHSIDSSGFFYVQGQLINVSSVQDVANFLATSNVGKACMAKRFYQYASGDGRPANDNCAMTQMQTTLSGNGSIKNMMKSYIQSSEFIYRNVLETR